MPFILGILIALSGEIYATSSFPHFPSGCGEFLAAVLTDIEDNTARLAAADLADERGDADGVFLRAGVQSEDWGRTQPYSRDTADARVTYEVHYERIKQNTKQDKFPILPDRGLAHTMVVPLALARQTVPRYWNKFPTLRGLKVTSGGSAIYQHAEAFWSWLSSTDIALHSLDLSSLEGIGPLGLQTLAHSRFASQLRDLNLSNLEGYFRRFGSLWVFERSMEWMTPEVWRRFFESPSGLSGLRKLNIANNFRSLEALAMSADKSAFHLTLEDLTVGGLEADYRLAADQLGFLLSRAFPKLTHLRWYGAGSDLSALVTAKGARKLKSLEVDFADELFGEAIAQVFDSKAKLSTLTSLTLTATEEPAAFDNYFLSQKPSFSESLSELNIKVALPSEAYSQLFKSTHLLHLKKLTLAGGTFTNRNFRELLTWKGASSLEELNLDYSLMTPEIFEALHEPSLIRKTKLRNLKILRVLGSSQHRGNLFSILDGLGKWPFTKDIHTLDLSGIEWPSKDSLVPLTAENEAFANLIDLKFAAPRPQENLKIKAFALPIEELKLPSLVILRLEGLGPQRVNWQKLTGLPRLQMVRESSRVWLRDTF